MTFDEVVEQLVEECGDDHVGLWEVVWAAREDLGASGPAELRAATLRLVRALLAEPGMQAGFPAPDGRHFLPWHVSPDEVIARVEGEWSALGRDPTIGDVVWFTGPEEGARPAGKASPGTDVAGGPA